MTAIVDFQSLDQAIINCIRCPRLVEYRQDVALQKRKAYQNEMYWGKPLPGWGDRSAQLLIVGLAPGAHGANRTGRMFTGDRSGDFLYPALYRAGFATRPRAIHSGDGLELMNTYMTNIVRCVPPDNRPIVGELAECRTYLLEELRLLEQVRVILALGQIAFDHTLRALVDLNIPLPVPRPRFAHAAHTHQEPYHIVGCYHPSQRNTSTGLLTPAMIDDVLKQVNSLLD